MLPSKRGRNVVALKKYYFSEWLEIYLAMCSGCWGYLILHPTGHQFFLPNHYRFSDWTSVFNSNNLYLFSLSLLFQATKKKITQFLLHEISGSHLIGYDVHLLISFVYSLNLSYCIFLTELLLYCGWVLCFINRVIIYFIVQTGTLLKIKGSALTSIN